MIRIRKREKSKRTAWGPCLVVLLCALGLLFAQTRLYGSGDVYQELLSLQLPFLYGMQTQTPKPASLVDVQFEEPAETPLPSADQNDGTSTSFDEGVGNEFRLTIERVEKTESIDLSGSAPTVLIYHTHTTEAYTSSEGYEYEQSSEWRTTDQTRNIVAVGEKLAQILREEYGISVIHDTTDHEPPKLSTAYSRSLETMLYYQAQYPSVSLFIDVHRDAYGSSADGAQDYVIINGKECARLMFVVGTGEGATGSGFDVMPDFESNYALAVAITELLNNYNANLTRSIRVKTGRYNQHVSSQCLLVEVGHNVNTLEQALNSVEYLAAAIAAVANQDVASGPSSFDQFISRWAP